MAGDFTHIQQEHRHIYCRMIGGRKVFIILPSSKAMKLTADLICLMADWTVSQEVIHPDT